MALDQGEMATQDLLRHVRKVVSISEDYASHASEDEAAKVRWEEAHRQRAIWEGAARRRWEELITLWNSKIVALERDAYGDGGRKLLAEAERKIWIRNELEGIRHSPADRRVAATAAARQQQSLAQEANALKARVTADLKMLREAGFSPVPIGTTNSHGTTVEAHLESLPPAR